MAGKGLLLAAPTSACGKTTVTLAIARALKNAGHPVAAAKSGPDYIDPAFHAAATGAPCVTLDAFAMPPARLKSLAATDGLRLIEGAMGLFDGAPPSGTGSAAHLAKTLGVPVILVVNAASLAQSVAPLVSGFLSHDPELTIAGIILNNVGSARHERMLREALPQSIPLFGAFPRSPQLKRPSRHLGLIQAGEDPRLESFLEAAAKIAADTLNLEAIAAAATPLPAPEKHNRFKPLGQNIAIASDEAFAFAYPHMLADWQAQGAALDPFSPLADEAPNPEADAIFLPGGYPELHAQRLASAGTFRAAMSAAAAKGVTIYGECGGYMTLGRSITDKRGVPYPMCGLLDLETSFAKRRLHLGYRHLSGPDGAYKGHEFHYATTTREQGNPLFTARDAEGADLGNIGLVSGSVSGSFAHLIDPDADE